MEELPVVDGVYYGLIGSRVVGEEIAPAIAAFIYARVPVEVRLAVLPPRCPCPDFIRLSGVREAESPDLDGPGEPVLELGRALVFLIPREKNGIVPNGFYLLYLYGGAAVCKAAFYGVRSA
jgi:hypothetical protein